MSVLSLVDLIGFEVGFDEQNERLDYDPQRVSCAGISTVKLSDIPVLLNKALRYPETVYSCYSGISPCGGNVSWPEGYSYDVSVIPVGLLGIEFVKTHVHETDDAKQGKASVVQVLNGDVTLLMQRNLPKKDIFDIDTRVERVIVADLRAGDKLAIPTGYMYTFINAGARPAVFGRTFRREHIIDYKKRLQRENGLAYYVIAKNARKELVANPRYRNIPAPEQPELAEINRMANYEPENETGLFEEVCGSRYKFSDMWS